MEGLKASAWVFFPYCIRVLFAIAIICLITIPLQIAMIVIGAIYKDECPVEDMIPIYLIVAGSAGLFSSGCMCGLRYKKIVENGVVIEEEKSVSALQPLMLLFLFPWFITGNVWIYKNYEPNYTDPSSPDFCNKTLYLFAFWVTISYYIIFGVVFLKMCLTRMRATCESEQV